MSTLAGPNGVGPFYVALIASWERQKKHVLLTTDLDYSLPSPRSIEARYTFVVRAERYGALHLARPRARLLDRWPLSWCRSQVTASPDRCLLVADFVRTAMRRGVVDPAFLLVDDKTPETMVVLPRRNSWYDGNRPA